MDTTTVSRRQALGILAAPLTLPLISACHDAFAPRLAPSFSAATDSITLIGAGDPHATAKNYAHTTGRLIKAALDQDPTAWAFSNGDLVPNGTAQEFATGYDAAWGSFKGRTLPTMGNHDQKADPSGAAYYDYWGAQAGERGKGYYAKTLGAWRLYFLNSQQVRQEQYAWLANDLPQWSPTHHIAAFWHIPMYASPCNMNSKPQSMAWPGNLGVGGFWKQLEPHGCEFVVSGHVHRYERFPRMLRNTSNLRLGTRSETGIRQFVIGTGGVGLMQPWPEKHPYLERQVVTRGIMRFRLHADSYDWSLTDLSGVVRDRGAQVCRQVAAV